MKKKNPLPLGRTHEVTEQAIAFACGQLGAWGALTRLKADPLDITVWTVHLVMGHLAQQSPPREIATWEHDPVFQQEVSKLLERYFGLTQQEQKQYQVRYYIMMYQPEYLPFILSKKRVGREIPPDFLPAFLQ